MSTKETDIATAFVCDVCHKIIDGVDREAVEYIQEHYPTAYVEQMMKAWIETTTLRILRGDIVVPDGEIVG